MPIEPVKRAAGGAVSGMFGADRAFRMPAESLREAQYLRTLGMSELSASFRLTALPNRTDKLIGWPGVRRGIDAGRCARAAGRSDAEIQPRRLCGFVNAG